MAKVEVQRFALDLRRIQRRRRWVAGLLFGLLSGAEYCAAKALVPSIRRAAFAVSVTLSSGLVQQYHN
jgi:hypothetical protein